MTAYFYNNQIYRNDVNGNAQTIYYMQDGEPPQITMHGRHRERRLFVLYRGQAGGARSPTATEPVYNFYPMDDIPPTQDLYLKGFKWEGARRPDAGRCVRPQDPTLAARRNVRGCVIRISRIMNAPRGAQETADRGAPLGRPQRPGRCRSPWSGCAKLGYEVGPAARTATSRAAG